MRSKITSFAGCLFFILCFLMFAPDSAFPQDGTGDGHAINWSMAVLKRNGSAYESVPFRQPLAMTRRDAYRLYLAFDTEDFDTKGHCYVIQEDDEGRLPFVYRTTVSHGDSITLPGEDRDFVTAEHPGTNRFYVIVSAEPRPNLEKLMDQHEQEDPAVSLDRSILSEVLAIRRSTSSGSGSSAESGRSRASRRDSPPAASGMTVPADPAIGAELYPFEGHSAWVVTITVRVR